MTRECIICGAAFEPGRYNQKVCGDACRRKRAVQAVQAARALAKALACAERFAKTCAECGRTFAARTLHTKTCGDACKKSRHARITKEWHQAHPEAILENTRRFQAKVKMAKTMTAKQILTAAGYSEEQIAAGLAYADAHDWADESERGAYALARILYSDDQLAETPQAPWECA